MRHFDSSRSGTLFGGAQNVDLLYGKLLEAGNKSLRGS